MLLETEMKVAFVSTEYCRCSIEVWKERTVLDYIRIMCFDV
jgi:hypothetical protein